MTTQESSNQPNLSRLHTRRPEVMAKAASVLAALMPVSGATIAEGLAAQPASAANPNTADLVSNHEAQSPQVFMAGLDKRANSLAQQIMHSKSAQVAGKEKEMQDAIEAIFPGCQVYDISMPDANKKGFYNGLFLLYNTQLKKVMEISYTTGDNTSKLSPNALTTHSGTAMKFMHIDNNWAYSPGGITLTDENDPQTKTTPGSYGQFYSVGSGYYTASGVDHINYSANPKPVVNQANKFFSAAETIVNYNN